MKKVVIFTSNYFNDSSAASILLLNLSNGLKRNGFLPLIIGTSSSRSLSPYSVSNNCAGEDEINFINIMFRFPILKHLCLPFYFIGKLRNEITKPCLVLLYGIDRPYWCLPINVYCRITNIKIVRIVSEVYNVENLFDKLLVIIEMIQIKLFDRWLDGVVVMSDYLEQVYNKQKEIRSLKIYHFIQVEKQRPFVSSEKFLVTFAGSYSKNNGVDTLFKAARILQDQNEIIFQILGEMPKSILDSEITKLNNLKFFGRLKHQEALVLISQSSLLVNPTTAGVHSDSGFPSKMAEYLMSGVPILSSRTGSIMYIFREHNCISFFDPGNEIDLAKMIYEVKDNYKSFLEKSKVSRKWALENLDKDKNALKLVNKFALILPNEK